MSIHNLDINSTHWADGTVEEANTRKMTLTEFVTLNRRCLITLPKQRAG